MQRLAHFLDGLLRQVLILLMVALVAAVVWQVISRYLFAAPSSWTEEVARFLLIWVGMLGAAHAFRNHMHIGLDLLPSALAGAPARLLERVSSLVILVFSVAVLIIGGSNLVKMTWELKQYSAALGLPIAVVYLVIPLTGVLMCVFALAAEPHSELRDSQSLPD